MENVSTFPSFLRRQESIGFTCLGIPAFAGMTAKRRFSTPSKGEKEFEDASIFVSFLVCSRKLFPG